mmetsp:Transcript_93148/g.150398  ORF Transcript_93148/g.150398 Transcript_93148/m.150398 type:complete len:205 (-) Transcript_93148:264-878(-)
MSSSVSILRNGIVRRRRLISICSSGDTVDSETSPRELCPLTSTDTAVAKWRASWSANSSVFTSGIYTLKMPCRRSSSMAHVSACRVTCVIVSSVHGQTTITASPANLMMSPLHDSTWSIIMPNIRLIVVVNISIPSCPNPWNRSERRVKPEISTCKTTHGCMSASRGGAALECRAQPGSESPPAFVPPISSIFLMATLGKNCLK